MSHWSLHLQEITLIITLIKYAFDSIRPLHRHDWLSLYPITIHPQIYFFNDWSWTSPLIEHFHVALRKRLIIHNSIHSFYWWSSDKCFVVNSDHFPITRLSHKSYILDKINAEANFVEILVVADHLITGTFLYSQPQKRISHSFLHSIHPSPNS